MAKVNTPSWGFQILLVFSWIQGFRTEEMRTISFDYDQCNRKTYIDVTKTKFEVNTRSQSTVLYRTTSCALIFKTEDGDICMDIKNINIEDCYVKLNVFTDMGSSEPKEVFSCNPSPTDFICSQKKVMKIQLIRKNLDVLNYEFTLIVMRKDVSQLNQTDVVSDGPMKTIIITVIVIIIIVAAIVILVCCYSKRSRQNRNASCNVPHTPQPALTQTIPSAPPANEVYYHNFYDPLPMENMLPKGDPPPYSEHS